MNRNYLLLLFVLLQTSAKAQLPDSIKAHIDTSLYLIKTHSLYAARVDWPNVEKQVYKKAATAKTREATFDALKIAFTALNDKHAAFYQYDSSFTITNTALMQRYSDSIRAAWAEGPQVKSSMLGSVAYLSIPYLGVTKQTDIDKTANWVYDAVAKLAANKPSGWVIDLRLNGGGNIRPMMAGLAPLFEDGVVSYYVDRDGTAMDKAEFKGGDFLIDGAVQAAINNKIPQLKAQKIAVLIGAGTGSSGEGVAAALQQRKNTRLFGEPSAGVANATNGFVFADNMAYFRISTAYLGDKSGKPLPEQVTPDVFVKANDHFRDLENDATVKAALQWLDQ